MRLDKNPANQPTVKVPQRANYSLVPDRPHPASARSTQPQDAAANVARSQVAAIYANDPNSLMDIEAEPASHGSTPPVAATTSTSNPPVISSPQISHSFRNERSRYLNDGEATDESTPSTRPPADTQQAPPQPRDTTSQAADLVAAAIVQEELATKNPYERSHNDTNLASNKSDWQHYHSAWQNYYQEYFHRYYAGHLEQMHAALEAKGTSTDTQEVTPEAAMDDIRSRLRANIRTRAKKFRTSRHFVPIVAALGVMLVFTFLQYNRVFFSVIQAYAVPGAIESSNIIVDPTLEVEVGPEPLLIIPKVNINVPVVWDTKPDHASQMAAMEHGVAWFGIPGANAKPGEIGNTVISGHSSNDWLENGDHKFVFAPLHRIVKDDIIYINYQSERFTYVVTNIEVVKPTDIQALTYETDKPVLTLITCTPLGTALNRLLITAEQVSPDPSAALPQSSDSAASETSAMPGVQPTIIERLFGVR